jgi:hypothetical protein
MKYTLLALLVIAASLSACCSTPKPAPAPMDGKTCHMAAKSH